MKEEEIDSDFGEARIKALHEQIEMKRFNQAKHELDTFFAQSDFV